MPLDNHRRAGRRLLIRWRVSALAVAAGATSGTAYVLQAVPGLSIAGQWTALGTGATLTIATVIADRIERRQRAAHLADAQELAKQARLEAIETTRSSITPGLDALVQLAATKDKPSRESLTHRLEQLVVGLACDIRSDGRAALFRYACRLDGSRVLMWEGAWRGGTNRHHRPRTAFQEGDQGPGDEMFRMLDTNKAFFVKDVEQEPRHLRRERRDYETYIAAPVAINGTKYGILCLDAPKSGDLTQDDVSTVRVLAMILAVGLAISGQEIATSAE